LWQKSVSTATTRGTQSSIRRRPALTHRLDAAAPLLVVDAAPARCLGGPGRAARHRPHGRGADELGQALERIGAVALLGAVVLRRDHQHAVAREPSAREPLEPRAHLVGERGRTAHVEAQLHRGRELVDVLPARAGGADEALDELALVERDMVGDADHDWLVRCYSLGTLLSRPRGHPQ